MLILLIFFFFFFNDTATTEIYTLSLHDALPISPASPPPAPGRSSAAPNAPTATSATVKAVASAGRPTVPPAATGPADPTNQRSGGWLPMPADPTPPRRALDAGEQGVTHPYQGSAPGPVSAGSRLPPARTTYRWRPLRTAQLRWRVDQTWTKLGSMGVPGPVRSRTPLALRSSATRDRSAGRARQGRYSSSHERIAYEDPRRWPVRGSSPLRQTRDGSGES